MGAVAGVVRALPPVVAPARALWHAATATAAAPPSLAAPTISDLSTFELGTVSKAGGRWTVDWDRARRDAQALMARIDLSKSNIVIWVPGTSNHNVMPAFEDQVRTAYGTDVSLAYESYEASWHMRESTPTGLATLLFVLRELKQRVRPGQHVYLGGESQGAWIVGEAMASPMADVVTRAALTGHPWVAKTHYDDGRDPRVQEINHVGDQVTAEVHGDVTTGLDAMIAIRTLQLGKIGTIVKGIAANPMQGWVLLRDLVLNLPFLKKFQSKPHVYGYEMPSAVAFLHDGTRCPSLKPPLKPSDPGYAT